MLPQRKAGFGYSCGLDELQGISSRVITIDDLSEPISVMPRGRPKSAVSGDGASVTKAIALLRMFIDGQEKWGVRELAQSLGQPGSSVHRLLQIFCNENLLQWDAESQKYSTGMEFFRWSAVMNRRLKFAEFARPIMADLAETVGESCWLGVYDENQHLHATIAEVLGSRPLSYSARIAEYRPLWESAGGLAILAFLPDGERAQILSGSAKNAPGKALAPRPSSADLKRIRNAGFAVDRRGEQDMPITVSAAIFNARNRPVGSLTIAIPPHRYPAEHGKDIHEAVLKSAHELSRMIGSQVVGGGRLGVWHQGLNAVANLIHQSMPAFNSTINNSGGDGAIRALQLGKGGYTFAVAGSLEAAYRGREPFDRPHTRLRAMFSFLPLYLHILAKRSTGARVFSDLKGHKISGGERDFTTARVLAEMLGYIGATSTAIQRQLIFLDYAEAQRQFVGGKLPVIGSLTGLGDSSYRNMARRADTNFVSINPEFARKFIGGHSTYSLAEIPASTYEGCDRPISTIMVPSIMVTTADRSDEEVYQVMHAIYDNRAELASISSGFSDFDPQSIMRGVRIPFHPAAQQFWIDQGLMKNIPSEKSLKAKDPRPRRSRAAAKSKK